MKFAAATLALLLIPSLVGAQGQCSRETLKVPVNESFSAPGGSYQASTVLHFLAGESASRQMDAVDMARLGSTGTLHLTLVYRNGQVQVESAILTPGAITIK